MAVCPDQAEELLAELQEEGLPAKIVGKIIERKDTEIYVI